MSRFITQLSASVLVWVGFVSPATADLSARDVWTKLQSSALVSGTELQADVAETSGGLLVSNIDMQVDLPDGSGTATIIVPRIALTEVDPDTVSLSIPDDVQITILTTDFDGTKRTAVLEYGNDELLVTASGTADDLNIDFAASQISVRLSELIVDDVPVEDARFLLTGTEASGSAHLGTADTTRMTKSVSFEAMDLDGFVPDPSEGTSADVQAHFDNVKMDVGLQVPEGAETTATEVIGAPGSELDLNLSFDAAQSRYDVTQAGTTVTGVAESAAGSYGLQIVDQGLTYRFALEDTRTAMSQAESPVDMTMTTVRSAMTVSVPIGSSETPQDVAFRFDLVDLALSDAFWDARDPNGILPRDPAQVEMDIVGKATPGSFGTQPARPSPLTMLRMMDEIEVKQFRVNAVGAFVTAMGAFTFDQSDLLSFGGVPRPEGAATVTLNGINGLFENLIALGALGRGQADGARMMMNAFVVPGDTPDSLISEIEIDEKGHVRANGLRIR